MNFVLLSTDMNPSVLHFSRVDSFFKLALLAGATVVCFYGANDLLGMEPEPVRQIMFPGGLELPAPSPRKDPLAPIKAAALVVGGCFGIFYVIRYGWRLFVREVAVRIDYDCVQFHPSITGAPNSLPLSDINLVLFDRADRIPKSDMDAFLHGYSLTGAWAARMGSKMRHMLYIGYKSGESIRLVDNDFDGGVPQLQRVADYLEKMRLAKVRSSAR